MKDAFLLHGFPWVEKDPNKQEYSLGKLEDGRRSSCLNSIFYPRRMTFGIKILKKQALCKDLKKQALCKDLKKPGVFLKVQGEDQYVHSVKQ